MTTHPEFARLLRHQLTVTDRNARWLSQQLQLHPSTVARWLNDETRPNTPETVSAIARVLAMQPAEQQQLLAAAGYGYTDPALPPVSTVLLIPDHRQSSLDRYLNRLLGKCNLLPWELLNPHYGSAETAEKFGLIDLYTALDVVELRKVSEGGALLRNCQSGQRLPVQKVVKDVKRLLILGEPGSGKTTLICYLAYRFGQINLAQNADTPPASSAGGLLPVIVECPRLAAFAQERSLQSGDVHLFQGYLAFRLAYEHQKDFWLQLQNVLESQAQALLLLFDGLDDVPTPQRTLIIEMINDLCQHYAQHQYIVTCRPYAYLGQPVLLCGFHQVSLAPFSPEQIERFVQNWYYRLVQQGRLHAEDAQQRHESLQRALQSSNLGTLAARPLLLTAIIQWHTFVGQLAEDHCRFYAEIIDLLLVRWEMRAGRRNSLSTYRAIADLKMGDIKAVLQYVAFQIHSQQQSPSSAMPRMGEVDEAVLRKWIASYLSDDWNKAGFFIDFVCERVGLWVQSDVEVYTVLHRSLQEFLAAAYLVSMADYPTEASHRVRENINHWREVFLLSINQARTGQAIAALNALCPGDLGQEVLPEQWRYALLAGKALHQIGRSEIGRAEIERQEAGRVLRNRVYGWLSCAINQEYFLSPFELADAQQIVADLMGQPKGPVRPVVSR